MATQACELTIQLWGIFEGVGCGYGAVELTGITLAIIGLFAYRLWLKSRPFPRETQLFNNSVVRPQSYQKDVSHDLGPAFSHDVAIVTALEPVSKACTDPKPSP